MYQVRITDPDGTNSIILEKADSITYNKTINSANEGISFEIPTADAKSANLDNTKLWELWDTVANIRKNRGPIYSIDDSDNGVLKVAGPGRSAFMSEHIQSSLVSFYNSPQAIMTSLTYENVASGPSTKSYVWDGKSTTKSLYFPADIIGTIDEEQYMQYYGLSKQTKDNSIDDNDGYILPGVERPSNTYTVTDSYWAGTDKKDSIIYDLGDIYSINKLGIIFPWWGGNQRLNDRGYAYRVYYSTYTGDFDGLTSGSWVLAHQETTGSVVTSASAGWDIRFETGVNTGKTVYTGITLDAVRYFRIVITNTFAWYGTIYDTSGPVDRWDWQCNPDTTDTRPSFTTGDPIPPAMKGLKINDRTIEPPNDCYASIVEFKAYTKLMDSDITDVIKQRIRGDNKQITYFHAPDASETFTMDTYRRYEPGSFFRHATVTYSGASNSYTKFFDKDCTNCYASFNFGVVDDYNSLIYRSDNTSGTDVAMGIPRYGRSITMKGASNAVVTSVDTWPAKVDPLSWGGQYSFTSIQDDYAYVEFRGRSFQWWATVPATETGATCLIRYRSLNNNTGNWSGWTTLEAGFQLPNDITSELVYEVPYEEVFVADTTYQVWIQNLDGGYLSIDSLGGWWSASIVDYNDDSDRFFLSQPDNWIQIYDNRFSNGTMYKTNVRGTRMNFGITGSRVQIFSAKGRNHGKITIAITHYDSRPSEYDPTDGSRVFIPGGDTGDGTLTVDLGTGKKGHEIPGYLLFDTARLTGWKFGSGGASMDQLPWGTYGYQIEYLDVETYIGDPLDTDIFVSRCEDCNPDVVDGVEINKYIYVDGVSVHDTVRMSGSWKLQPNTDVLSSITEALQLEWDIGENGLNVQNRIGDDTDVILLEGVNTVISSEVIRDGSKMATILYSSGADIDGLPLFTIVEDKKNRRILGRTIQKIQDYRDLADYFTLVGVSRAELIRRREPEYRINAVHSKYKYGLEAGDSILIKKRRDSVPIRARIDTLTITQSKNNGIVYQLECEKWPPIV